MKKIILSALMVGFLNSVSVESCWANNAMNDIAGQKAILDKSADAGELDVAALRVVNVLTGQPHGFGNVATDDQKTKLREALALSVNKASDGALGQMKQVVHKSAQDENSPYKLHLQEVSNLFDDFVTARENEQKDKKEKLDKEQAKQQDYPNEGHLFKGEVGKNWLFKITRGPDVGKTVCVHSDKIDNIYPNIKVGERMRLKQVHRRATCQYEGTNYPIAIGLTDWFDFK